MPFREYYCEDCDTHFEDHCSFSDPIISECPDCDSENFYQDLTGVHVAVKRYNTVGALGEANAKLLKNKKQEEEGRKQEKDREEFEIRRQRIESAVPGAKVYHKDDIQEPYYGSMPKEKKKEIFRDKQGKARVKAIEKYVKEGK